MSGAQTTRRAYRPDELPEHIKEAVRDARMEPGHEHLDALMNTRAPGTTACDLGCEVSCAPNGDCFLLDAAPQGISPADRASMFIDWCALQGFGIKGWPEGAYAQLVAHLQEAARGR